MIFRCPFNELWMTNTMKKMLSPTASLALTLAACLLFPALAISNASATPTAGAPTADNQNAGPSITGFRGANFGMTEAQVRSAIESDFKLPAAAISAGENVAQRTDVLIATVPNLIPGGGKATIAYIFGYQSHKLMQITVVWSSQIDSTVTPRTLQLNGVTLQQYFAAEGFPPQRTEGNLATPNGELLFRATDPAGNVVGLLISGTIAKQSASTKTPAFVPAELTLTYASNAQHPDIFQLQKGSF